MSADAGRKMKPSESSNVTELVIPEHLKCPLTGELMINPVSTCYGHVYDGWAIYGWLDAGNTTDPLTRQPLFKKNCSPCFSLIGAVEDEKYNQIRKRIIDSRNEESLKQLLIQINQLNQLNQVNPSSIQIKYYDQITCDTYLKGIYVSQKVLDSFFLDMQFDEKNALNDVLSNLNKLFRKLNDIEKSAAFPNKVLARKYEKEYKVFKTNLLLLPREITYELLKDWASSRRNLQKTGVKFNTSDNRSICDLKQFAMAIENGELDKKVLKATFENESTFYIACKRLKIKIKEFIQNKAINVDRKISFIQQSKLIESICRNSTDDNGIDNTEFLMFLQDITKKGLSNERVESIIQHCIDYKKDKYEFILKHLIDKKNISTSNVNSETSAKSEYNNNTDLLDEQEKPSTLDVLPSFIKAHKTSLSLISMVSGVGLCIYDITLPDINISLAILGVSLLLLGIAIIYYGNNNNESNDEMEYESFTYSK